VFLTSQTGEDLDASVTRVWTASECLKKAGVMANVPVRFGAKKGDGWILLKAGSFLLATYIARIAEEEDQLVFTICSEVESSRELGYHTRNGERDADV
jgi:enediyne polyketide synthase